MICTNTACDLTRLDRWQPPWGDPSWILVRRGRGATAVVAGGGGPGCGTGTGAAVHQSPQAFSSSRVTPSKFWM